MGILKDSNEKKPKLRRMEEESEESERKERSRLSLPIRVFLAGAALGTAFGVGTEFSNLKDKIYNYYLYENLEIEKGFYRDPYGVWIEERVNQHDHKEFYIKHYESNTEVPLTEDFFERERYEENHLDTQSD